MSVDRGTLAMEIAIKACVEQANCALDHRLAHEHVAIGLHPVSIEGIAVGADKLCVIALKVTTDTSAL